MTKFYERMSPYTGYLCTIVIVATVAGLSIPPDGPPLDPADALSTFELVDSFRIEVFASEPLIADPVDMDVDEFGRIFVVEMPGYPLDIEGSGRIKLLSDTDGDGLPDSASVFASGLTLPTGVMRWKDGILVTDAPNVYYLEDTDADGRADVRDTVLTGFALSNPQHNFNNPLYGLDNGIYLANNGPIYTEAFDAEFGDTGSDVRYAASYREKIVPNRDRPSMDEVRLGKNATNRNVRFRPDTGELEALSSASQWGHAFNWRGAHFLVSNAAHQYHEVVSQRYLQRNPALPVRNAVSSTPEHGDAAEVYPITLDPDHQLLTDRGVFTSASGITLYNGGKFPPLYDRVAFVAEPVHNLIHADAIEPDGATYRATRLLEGREFLASTDSWFRPVNFYVGPDGALYVVDYYREIVEHPEWMDEEAVRTRDLYSGSDRGRIYRITYEGSRGSEWPGAHSLAERSDAELVSVLDHENAWWRFTAQRLLVDRGDHVDGDAVDALRKKVGSPAGSAAGRVHALWTLEGLDQIGDDDIKAALQNGDGGVRENAVRIAERHVARRFESYLIGMIDDPDPRVRFQVLLTLGEVEGRRSEEARLHLLLADLEDPWVHVAALTADTQPSYEQLRTTLDLLESSGREGSTAYIRQVAMLVAGAGESSDISQAIDLVLSRPERLAAIDLLEGIAAGLRQRSDSNPIDVTRTRALLELFFDREGGDERRSALLGVLKALRGQWLDPATSEQAVHVATDRSASSLFRRDALALLEVVDAAPFAAELRALIENRPHPDVEAAAIRALGHSSESNLADFLLEHFLKLSIPGREASLDVLMQTERGVRELLDAVESGMITPEALGWGRRVALMRDWDGDVKEQARRLLRVSEAARADVLQAYAPALESGGDVESGHRVYLAECSVCHAFGAEGLSFGPDLRTVSHWSPRAMLEAIVAPSRSVADGYETWRIERRGGEQFSGVIRAETASAVTLAMQGGVEITVPRTEIESMAQLEGSSMPIGLEERISVEEMAALITFLTGAP